MKSAKKLKDAKIFKVELNTPSIWLKGVFAANGAVKIKANPFCVFKKVQEF
jgi:hypothetical protein